jgi:hypothetical protein
MAKCEKFLREQEPLMMKIEIPRPVTCLTVLALTTVTFSDCKWGYAAQPMDAIQVDADFVPYVLAPMLSLVPSPYADPASLNNPLGVDQWVTPRSDAMRAVVSHNVSHHTTTALDANTNEHAPKIASPPAGDFTLTAQITTSIEQSTKEVSPWKNSFVMTDARSLNRRR